ncbi:hypothetical protein WJX73_002899 [Symbiochloris irregularis]|uniref:GDP-Man:Man(3)GlcNAc(2)-PP-Dol alpha-1,2-mannosyltransferase n=1 Tax=Symbiochloris irregularis TaxID=706552 RepID=A0AAW1P0C3_9CHLO
MAIVSLFLLLLLPACVSALLGMVIGLVNTLILGIVIFAIVATAALVGRLVLRVLLSEQRKGCVAFFHPNATGGGGGERVLWCAIKAMQEEFPSVELVLYVDGASERKEYCASARERFNIDVQASRLKVVDVEGCHLLQPELYPSFTLVGQAWASVQVAYNALWELNPEVFVDTSGWAFMYPLARLAGCRVACYTHYPTISTDMLTRVYNRESLYNNSAQIASSLPKSLAKLMYYYAFALAYGLAGSFAQVVMVNSSWTNDHIAALWWRLKPPLTVYPPCDTTTLQKLPLDRKLKRLYLVSVAQFRPEKNHEMQLVAFAHARANAAHFSHAMGEALNVAQLISVGSCRNQADRDRVAKLQHTARRLGIEDRVQFCVNIPYAELQTLLGGAVGGLHTMVDEHFGISVVEYMAAGVIPIAHNSGGPRQDIVGGEHRSELLPTPPTVPHMHRVPSPDTRVGYLCTSMEEYAAAIVEVLCMDQSARLEIADVARRKAAHFSDENFARGFLSALATILPSSPGQTGSNVLQSKLS